MKWIAAVLVRGRSMRWVWISNACVWKDFRMRGYEVEKLGFKLWLSPQDFSFSNKSKWRNGCDFSSPPKIKKKRKTQLYPRNRYHPPTHTHTPTLLLAFSSLQNALWHQGGKHRSMWQNAYNQWSDHTQEESIITWVTIHHPCSREMPYTFRHLLFLVSYFWTTPFG